MPRPPKMLHDFIGQPRVISQLRKFAAGARARGEAMPSILLVAPPGFGKSALADAIAREYIGPSVSAAPSPAKRIMGAQRQSVTLVRLLGQLQHGDVLFLDEAHSLDGEAQEGVGDRSVLGGFHAASFHIVQTTQYTRDGSFAVGAARIAL